VTIQDRPTSPRIAALQDDVVAGTPAVVDAFWREVGAQTTPLIEAIPGDDAHRLVTFLWRAEEKTTNVVVFGGFVYYFDFAHNQMTRLLDTDVWYKTDRVRADVRAWYRLALNDSLEPSPDWVARTAGFRSDPLNPRQYLVKGSADSPFGPRDEVWSVIELPETPPQQWVQRRSDVPRGRVDERHMHSDLLDNDRLLWIYTPPAYAPDTESYPLVVLLDGYIYAHVIPTPTILDNLIATGHLPPVVALMVNPPDLDTRLSELACSQPFVDFLAQELVPWARQEYHVTTDPARVVVGGSSLGGLTAAFAGLRYPDVFGNVLSQSGSFWWRPQGDREPHWLGRQFEVSPRVSLRFYLDVGCLESEGQRRANESMRDLLRAKGCPVQYAEFSGGHTFLCWQGTLPDGLHALLGANTAER
jgi:enterochelin esterase-like enzyme